MSTETDTTAEPQVSDETTNKWVRRITAMLEKAENAGTEEEAATYRTRAYELMEKYAIEEAMLGNTEQKVDEQIITVVMKFTGIYREHRANLVWSIIRGCMCRGVYWDNTWTRPKTYELTIHGFESDVARVQLLAASLELQCATALKGWEREQSVTWNEQAAFAKFKDRRAFMDAFASAVGSKLAAATRVATEEYAQGRAAATEGGESVEDATTGVEIALRDRRQRVQDWMDRKYGQLSGGTSRRRASGSMNAYTAGAAAGRAADTGTTRVGGGRRALTS